MRPDLTNYKREWWKRVLLLVPIVFMGGVWFTPLMSWAKFSLCTVAFLPLAGLVYLFLDEVFMMVYELLAIIGYASSTDEPESKQ